MGRRVAEVPAQWDDRPRGGRHLAGGSVPRHRDVPPSVLDDCTEPANTGPLRIAGHARRRRASLAATGMVVLAAGTGAHALTVRPGPVSVSVETSQVPVVTAGTPPLGFPRVAVGSVAAPVEAPVVKAEAPVPVPVAEPVPVPVPVPTVAPPIVRPAPVAPVAPPPPPPPPSDKGPVIVAAALAQLGAIQDCTALVSNSLRAVGINFHDWPAGYLSLGPVVSAAEARPGDLIYYANGGTGVAHIAVYAGAGVAVHGGWSGNQTVTFSAYVGSGPVFIRVL